ncbi:MAG: aminotransferase class III-fold pyridoxal phosphate-dependent enzyme [Bacteroidia bacterium]|nr:aminotransferase class III-fold pyridoxal phosphate-dependent enzyme [Bacteroidia bacterium]
MNLFDVYSLFDVIPVKGQGCHVWDDKGQEYLDLYGGHAVISVGHTHPHYVKRISDQLNKIGFYSNSVINPLQVELAEKIGKISGYDDYSLFLVNSGAEANENALKLASFHTGKDKVVAFRHSFHGRTSGAVAVTDNPKIVSPFNAVHKVLWAELNNISSVEEHLKSGEVAAVIIEGIQGVGGIHIPTNEFLQDLRALCDKYDVVLILDEIQSGYGRSGKFFAHQYSGIKADVITMAKGIGNGFPLGGILIAPKFEPVKGMLGTTFGGNYLAMAAGIAVAEIFEQEGLVENAAKVGQYILDHLPKSDKIKEVRGIGMMIGIEFHESIKEIRTKLLFEKHIFTGVAGPNMIRLLPPLCLTQAEADRFLEAFAELLK